MYRRLALAAIICLAALQAPSLAAPLEPVQAVINSFESAVTDSGMEARLIGGAKLLFYFLALIQISWAVGMEMLGGSGTFQSVVACVARQSLHIAFFYLLLVPTPLTGGDNILRVIVDGIESMGVSLTGVTNFNDILSMGVEVAAILWKQINEHCSLFSPVTSLGAIIIGGLCTIVILLSFALASLSIVITLCRIYLTTSVTVFFLGFGGNQYTKDIAVNALRSAFIAGMELFVMYVLASVGGDIFRTIADWSDNGITDDNVFAVTFSLTAAAIIFAGCLKTLPGYVSGVVSGASGGMGGASLPGVAGAAAMIAGAAAAGAGIAGGAALGGFRNSAAGGGAGGVASVLKGAALGGYAGSQGGLQQLVRSAGMKTLRGNGSPKAPDGPAQPSYNNITGAPSGGRVSPPSDENAQEKTEDGDKS